MLGFAALGLAGCGQKTEPVPTPHAAAQADRTINPAPAAAPREKAGKESASFLPKSPAAGLPRYDLQIDPAQLLALENNPDSSETRPATLVADGTVYRGVQVRFRGEWARSWPKKPFKIFFSPDQPYHGHRSVNLNSAWRDASFVRETLAYHVYAACGAVASGSRLVHLDVNGEFRGLYVEVEQVDKPFLKRVGLGGASLFKSTSDDNQADERDHGSEAAFRGHYENETDKSEGLGELQRFCHDLATTTNAEAFFETRLDLDRYINYLAATVLIQHWDGYNKNHFVVHDRRGSGRWQVLPWDLDRTFGDHWNQSFDATDLPIALGTRTAPSVTGWNRLQDRFLAVPALRTRFHRRLAQLLETEFTPARLNPILDHLEATLAADAASDRRRWRGPRGGLSAGIAGVKRFIERRREFLQGELKRMQPAG